MGSDEIIKGVHGNDTFSNYPDFFTKTESIAMEMTVKCMYLCLYLFMFMLLTAQIRMCIIKGVHYIEIKLLLHTCIISC